MEKLDVSQFTEFDGHHAVYRFENTAVGLRGFIAIHRSSSETPALGATRLWRYNTRDDALREALCLSRGMSYKAALAGLNYGGAKAVLMANPRAMRGRKSLFRAYANVVNALAGKFITGTDVGVDQHDVNLMRQETPYVIGHKVNPSKATAIGITFGIKAALKSIFKDERLAGHSFAIQGVGKTGSELLKQLYKEAENIYVADIDREKIRGLKERYPRVQVVSPAAIYHQRVDVFCPCALSGILNSKTIPQLKCRVVAGSANTQLSVSEMGALLYSRGILYAPDYVINAGGLIAVVEELEHKNPKEKRIEARVRGIRKTLATIFDKSKHQNKPTDQIANAMAEKIFNNHSQVS